MVQVNTFLYEQGKFPLPCWQVRIPVYVFIRFLQIIGERTSGETQIH